MPDLLLFTEAGTKKRASLRLVKGEDGLAACDPGGLEVFATDLAGFACRLRESRHTLKRTLTDQRVFAGIGNAYSDEILLHAGLSPFKRARDMQDDEAERLFDACRQTLADWTEILRARAGDRFPEKVTAFHDEMAAHGKYRPAAVPRVRRPDPAHRPRGERKQLLCPLSDRRARACRSVAVEAPEGDMAAAHRGAGRELTRGAVGSRQMVEDRIG